MRAAGEEAQSQTLKVAWQTTARGGGGLQELSKVLYILIFS